MDALVRGVWPQSPLPWELPAQDTVVVWTFPSLSQVTAETHEQAAILSLATYAAVRWSMVWAWPDTLTYEKTNWEDAAWVLLAPWMVLAFLLLLI